MMIANVITPYLLSGESSEFNVEGDTMRTRS